MYSHRVIHRSPRKRVSFKNSDYLRASFTLNRHRLAFYRQRHAIAHVADWQERCLRATFKTPTIIEDLIKLQSDQNIVTKLRSNGHEAMLLHIAQFTGIFWTFLRWKRAQYKLAGVLNSISRAPFSHIHADQTTTFFLSNIR